MSVNSVHYLFDSVYSPKEVDSSGPTQTHLITSLFKGFKERFRLMGQGLPCSKSDSHGCSDTDGRSTANGHGSNGLRHSRGIPAIQIADLPRKPPLVEQSYPVTFPFNGFEFHNMITPITKARLQRFRLNLNLLVSCGAVHSPIWDSPFPGSVSSLLPRRSRRFSISIF